MKKPITLRDTAAWLWEKAWPALAAVAIFAYIFGVARFIESW